MTCDKHERCAEQHSNYSKTTSWMKPHCANCGQEMAAESAKEAYARRLASARRHLESIERGLEMHADDDDTNWGLVGDMAEADNKLAALNEFIGLSSDWTAEDDEREAAIDAAKLRQHEAEEAAS